MRRDSWSKRRHVITEKYLEWVFEMNQFKSQKILISDISEINYYLEKKRRQQENNLDRKSG
jgi:hypothetical protein